MKHYILPICYTILLCMLIWIFWPRIDSDDAIDAIVGEASNQTDDTMICVAQAIRHRGTLKGVYGLHAKHNQYETVDTWERAEDAWEQSALMPDRINGAKNFKSLSDIVESLNYKGGIFKYKAKCGDFYFY